MIISAVIYGFLRTPKCGNLSDLDRIYEDQAWYLPPILNFLGLVPWRESITMIVALAAYLRASKLAQMGEGLGSLSRRSSKAPHKSDDGGLRI